MAVAVKALKNFKRKTVNFAYHVLFFKIDTYAKYTE